LHYVPTKTTPCLDWHHFHSWLLLILTLPVLTQWPDLTQQPNMTMQWPNRTGPNSTGPTTWPDRWPDPTQGFDLMSVNIYASYIENFFVRSLLDVKYIFTHIFHISAFLYRCFQGNMFFLLSRCFFPNSFYPKSHW
jgi:hypothetical protein